MSKFVRSSKFRHVFGQPAKKEKLYDGIKVSRSAWDSNKVTGNPKYVAVQWESGGGGAVACMNIEKAGKQPPNLPLICGHKGAVLDMDFNPFNDQILATVSEDTTTKIWKIPDEGLTENMTEPVQNLTNHRKKVGTARFHPSANNVLCTSSTDSVVKIWDIEKGAELFSNSDAHSDIIQSTSWNWDGSMLATSCKDKKLRLFDPRSSTEASAVDAHPGVKGFRAVFTAKPTEKIFTVGFSKTSERQYALWDPKKLDAPVAKAAIDNASGLLIPFYDDDTGVMFLAGKGDGNIRYYEITDEGQFVYFLSEYKSSASQNGVGRIPKRGLDLQSCEIIRLLKATSTHIEPIQFCVPRKGDQFQDDLYPPTPGPEPAQSADDYKGGANAEPKLITLELGKTVGTCGSFSASAPAASGDAAVIADLKAQLKTKDDKIAELEAKIKELQA